MVEANKNQARPQRLERLRAEIEDDHELTARILARPEVWPPIAEDLDRRLRCSPSNVDQALCRAIALAVVQREFWQIELVKERA
jgi:hypothetical protein